MEEYIVSARKYRPSDFDTVVGQESLTTTLKNAIASGKLAHAYLFCGPRGVGKTTCARIFAKTINCLSPQENGEACNECESCRAFNEQRSMNIHELDAASNNSVEEIRSLIDKVRIPPQVGKYKVFIIDEVHMLSAAAFNAFLKTLEEPPSYVIFILATTEKHKILPTILSRCQVYDFNRMSIGSIINHLQFVAEKEGISYEPEALNIIAQKADGGMRDALSIFDQTVSFTGGNLTYQKIIETLNVLDYEHYFKLVDHFLANEVAQCMLIFNQILNKGFDGSHFITGLAAHLRDLMVGKDEVTIPLLEVSENIRTRYQEQAKKCPAKFLYNAIKLCNDCDLNYRQSKNKRLLVEITLIQLAQLTLEDDAVGSGLCPEKILKPIFTQPTEAITTTAPVNQRAPQAQAEKVAPTTERNENTYTPRQSPLPIGNNTEKDKPKVKISSFGTSIRKTTATATTTPATPIANEEKGTLVNENEDFPVTEDNICFYWHEFVNLLPQEETAMAQRMKIIRPKLIKDETFEVVVDNDQVKVYMTRMAPRIEAHMRQQLHNKKITMQVRTAKPQEVTRIYSKPQQYIAMCKSNPSLQKLRDALNLEFA